MRPALPGRPTLTVLVKSRSLWVRPQSVGFGQCPAQSLDMLRLQPRAPAIRKPKPRAAPAFHDLLAVAHKMWMLHLPHQHACSAPAPSRECQERSSGRTGPLFPFTARCCLDGARFSSWGVNGLPVMERSDHSGIPLHADPFQPTSPNTRRSPERTQAIAADATPFQPDDPKPPHHGMLRASPPNPQALPIEKGAFRSPCSS